MASAMFAPHVKEEQEHPSESDQANWEDTAQGSSRLLETHRRSIEAEIKHAGTLLELDMEDGETVYSEETLGRAIAFLKLHIDSVWMSYGVKAPVPTIGSGPRGSVDLFWKEPFWELLVNIPASTNDLATFYARDDKRQTAKGSFDPTQFTQSIATWLMI